jgi:hypothetical protein
MGLSRAVSTVSVKRVFGRGTPAALALLKAAWPAAVGPELARRTEVLALEGSAMRVRIPDARWRKVLHRMQPEILERLRRVAGDLAPRRLGFSERPPSPAGGHERWGGEAAVRPNAAFGASPPPTWGGDRGGGSMNEEPAAMLPQGVAAAARCIDDPEIRARFERSAARYLSAFRRSSCVKP